MEVKRKNRSANYTAREKDLLIDIVSKYKDVIENKKTDGPSTAEKNHMWKKIETEFNLASPDMCFRNWESLKKLFENQKKELRKKVANQRKDLYLTGGGPPSNESSYGSDEVLLSIVNNKTVMGLNNPFDNDFLPSSKVSTKVEKDSSCYPAKGNCEPPEENDMELSYGTSENLEDNNMELNYVTSENSRSPIAGTSAVSKQERVAEQTPVRHHYRLGRSTARKTENMVDGQRRQQLKRTHSRRRPQSTIQLSSASTLYDKYEQLLEKKIANENFVAKESQLRMEQMLKKFDLEIESIKLDIQIKKKQLEAMQ